MTAKYNDLLKYRVITCNRLCRHGRSDRQRKQHTGQDNVAPEQIHFHKITLHLKTLEILLGIVSEVGDIVLNSLT
jgi:hypothetical protein